MTEPVDPATGPATVRTLTNQLRSLGIEEGDVLLVHSSLRALGYVVGGAHAVVLALRAAVGDTGTIVVPTHSGDRTEPRHWRAPPVPEAWWETIRRETPAFDPALTATRQMGAIADTVRTHPDAVRSAHPHVSFAAWGPHAGEIVRDHALEDGFGERSPLARVHAFDGRVLLAGVTHANNTSLHLAERRAGLGEPVEQGARLWMDGEDRWVTFEKPQDDSDDFAALGEAFERETGAVTIGPLGQAAGRAMKQREIVDWAIPWLVRTRRLAGPPA